jgi:hypothetical protein
VCKVASPRKLIDILFSESKLSVLDASYGRDDARSEEVQDVVAWSRPESWGLESIDDSEPEEPNHPSSGDGSGAEIHLLDLVDGKDPLLEKVFK